MLWTAKQMIVYEILYTFFSFGGLSRFCLKIIPFYKFYYLLHMTNNTHSNPKQILATSNSYVVLGIDRNSSNNQIKKAYREMALRYHPDKNKIPQAKQIFNKVVQAYNILSNQSTRSAHDQSIYSQQKKRTYQPVYEPKGPSWKPKKTDDEPRSYSFERFSGSQYQKNPYKQPRFSYQSNKSKKKAYNQQKFEKKGKYRGTFKEKKNNSLAYFLIILFFVFSFFFTNRVAEPVFLLSPNNVFTQKMKTKLLKVDYFIKPDHNSNKNPIVEEQIQKNYIRKLEKQCLHFLKAKNMYEKLAQRAIKESYKTLLLIQAQKINLKSCHKIRKIKRKHPNIKLQLFDLKIADF